MSSEKASSSPSLARSTSLTCTADPLRPRPVGRFTDYRWSRPPEGSDRFGRGQPEQGEARIEAIDLHLRPRPRAPALERHSEALCVARLAAGREPPEAIGLVAHGEADPVRGWI